jgi:hypothetical protein
MIATGVKRSDSIGDIQVRVTVGGVGGLSSDPTPFTVNYPKVINDLGEQTVPSTGGTGPGYETRFSYQTRDLGNWVVPRIAINEKFLNPQNPVSNNWAPFMSQGFPFPVMQATNIWFDKVSMFPSIQTPTLNPALVLPPLAPDDTVVQQAEQQWRVGSSMVGQGVYLIQIDELKRRKSRATNDTLNHIAVP